jgi:hypothetical protein
METKNRQKDEILSASPSWAVSQCRNGCVHLQCQHLTMTFTPSEFARFAQLIGEAYVRLGVRAAVAAGSAH